MAACMAKPQRGPYLPATPHFYFAVPCPAISAPAVLYDFENPCVLIVWRSLLCYVPTYALRADNRAASGLRALS
jgi:hypothetical protein